MAEIITCYAFLNARIEPLFRGNVFEDPLQRAFEENRFGNVTGGGSKGSKAGEVLSCGIDLDIQYTMDAIKFTAQFLHDRGAPKGSKLQFTHGGKKYEARFGSTEGLAIYINGTDLPAEVYRRSDINLVMDTFATLTAKTCKMRSSWRGPTETAIYLYGPSAAVIQADIADFMAKYPLCQQARIVQIA